jgi:hypothetical protein
MVTESLAMHVPIDKSPSTIWNLTKLGETMMFGIFVLLLCIVLNSIQ